MGRLWRYLGRYRGRELAGIACLFGATSLAMLVPWLLKRAVDAMVAGRPRRELAATLVLIAVVAAVQAVVRTFSRFVIFNVGRDIEYDLRNDLFAHLERLPVGFYQQRQTGDLMSRLVNDVTAVRLLLGPGVLNLVNTPLYYAYGLTIMLSMDARLTVLALGIYPLTLLFVKRMSRVLMERTLRVQEGLGTLSSRVQESLSGIHVLRAYAAEASAIAGFREANAEFQAASLRLARVRGLIGPVMSIVGGLGTLVVLWYGGMRVVAGALGLGDLVAFIGYLHLLAWPTMALGWMLSVLQRGRAAMQRLGELFAVAPAIADAPGALAPAGCRGALELRGVTFRYPGSERAPPVLDRVDLAIPAGRTVAIVGRTGAGKSALAQLLPRLFDPEAGAVLLDGRDIRTLPLAWLRRQIGTVPQDPFLFSRTVGDNVAFALDGEARDRVAWAIDAVALGREVTGMPRGIDTLVGERGITLSGGQKQRVALARVLAANPRVLVLDDALSSVDAATEAAILARLRDFFRERTTLLVSHRLTTVQEADEIVVLDEGRVAERGTHAALLARGGIYAALFRQQAVERELEAI